MNLKCYNTEFHSACFALPQFARKVCCTLIGLTQSRPRTCNNVFILKSDVFFTWSGRLFHAVGVATEGSSCPTSLKTTGLVAYFICNPSDQNIFCNRCKLDNCSNSIQTEG